jgi:putative transposase
MHFEKNTVYHIFNQGNNQQTIFFKHENYLFFLQKMREYILPYGEILCYCLMPNHFHWLIYVRETEIDHSIASVGMTLSHPDTSITTTKIRTLNESIGILLRSYTRAINNQEGRSGSLFREETKAKNGWEDPNLTLLNKNYSKIWQNWELYGSTCFFYIHNNPVKSNLTKKQEDWPYSSAKDFAGLRNGTLCNQILAKKLLFLV